MRPQEQPLSGWSDLLNNDDAVWLPLTRLLNSPFRFRPSKSFSPYWSTPDSYFTPSNNILQLFAINSHDIWIEREKGKLFESYESIFPLFLYRTYIKSCVWPGSAGVNVHNSQGHAPSKTSDLNFQPHVTPATPSTITQTRLWPPTNLSKRSRLHCTEKPSEIFSFFWFLSVPALCLSAQRVRRRPAAVLPLPAVADTVSNRTFSSSGSLMALRHAHCLLPLVRIERLLIRTVLQTVENGFHLNLWKSPRQAKENKSGWKSTNPSPV